MLNSDTDLFSFTIFFCCAPPDLQILREEILPFVNAVAEKVHEEALENQGFPNKNIGDAFLLVWKMRSLEHMHQREQAIFSLRYASAIIFPYPIACTRIEEAHEETFMFVFHQILSRNLDRSLEQQCHQAPSAQSADHNSGLLLEAGLWLPCWVWRQCDIFHSLAKKKSKKQF
jgi:hypothetical protein